MDIKKIILDCIEYEMYSEALILLKESDFDSVLFGKNDKFFDKLKEKTNKTDNEIKELFMKLAKLDPTTKDNFVGNYVRWIVNLYLRNNNEEMFWDDSPNITEYLEIFNKNKTKLPSELRDINKFRTLPDLFNALKEIGVKGSSGNTDIKNDKDLKVIYNDSIWNASIPTTKQCAYDNWNWTEWCTSKYRLNDPQNRNRYDSYAKKGELVVITNKKNPKNPWQMYLSPNDFEFNDVSNNPVKLFFWIVENNPPKELMNAIRQVAEKNNSSQAKFLKVPENEKEGAIMELQYYGIDESNVTWNPDGTVDINGNISL